MVVNILSFYNMLLGIEIAVFGITIAVVFVFIQLVYSSYSHRQIWLILKNPYLICWLVLNLISIMATAAGSLFLSLGQYDFIPNFYLRSKLIVTNDWFLLLSLISIPVSMAPFVVFVVKNLGLLRPSQVLLLTSRGIKYKELRSFLFKKYNVQSPEEWWRLHIAVQSTDPIIDKGEIKKQSDRDVKLYNKIQTEAAIATDPLDPVLDVGIRAIHNADLKTLNVVRDTLIQVSRDFIQSIPDTSTYGWDPDKTLADNYTDHFIDTVKTHIEICEHHGLSSAKRILLETSRLYAGILIENKFPMSLGKVLNLWKTTADSAISVSPQIFSKVTKYYYEIGKSTLDCEQEGILEEVFCHLGWLGKRVLEKLPLGEKPLMVDDSYYTEHEELINVLLSFSDEYNHRHPELYPLTFFSAIDVVIWNLIPIYAEKPKNKVAREYIIYSYLAFSSFAECAIPIGNSKGAGLAVLRLKEAYHKLVENGVENIAAAAIESVTKIGMSAAAHHDKLGISEVIDQSIDDYVMDMLEKCHDHDAVSEYIKQNYIRTIGNDGDRDAIWSFITTLGHRMGTSFGLNFDPVTGERYADDDPRRR